MAFESVWLLTVCKYIGQKLHSLEADNTVKMGESVAHTHAQVILFRDQRPQCYTLKARCHVRFSQDDSSSLWRGEDEDDAMEDSASTTVLWAGVTLGGLGLLIAAGGIRRKRGSYTGKQTDIVYLIDYPNLLYMHKSSKLYGLFLLYGLD